MKHKSATLVLLYLVVVLPSCKNEEDVAVRTWRKYGWAEYTIHTDERDTVKARSPFVSTLWCGGRRVDSIERLERIIPLLEKGESLWIGGEGNLLIESMYDDTVLMNGSPRTVKRFFISDDTKRAGVATSESEREVEGASGFEAEFLYDEEIGIIMMLCYHAYSIVLDEYAIYKSGRLKNRIVVEGINDTSILGRHMFEIDRWGKETE